MNALAGRFTDALPDLRVVAESCHALADPIAWVRAQLQLGQALEATGDIAGACAAYGAVLERWGSAKRSVTATVAAAHAKSLSCAR